MNEYDNNAGGQNDAQTNGQTSSQNDSQNYRDYYYTQGTYSQNGYSQGNGSYQEPPKKKGGVGKVLAITLGMVLLVGVAAIGGYSAHTIFERLTNGTVENETEAENDSQKITVIQPDTQNTVSQGSTGGVILTDVSGVVEQVMPTVVAITNSSYYTYNTGFGFWGSTTQVPTESSGSGIIIGQNDTELLIVTNNHVIEDNESLTVQFVDGSTANATVKGAKSSVDIAIVAVPLKELTSETKSAIAIAVVGDSGSLRMGQGVIAIGNAMGYGQSVTTGCISALNRQVTTDAGNTLTVLQTDAAINPGNSGGALLNQNGEVIGINTAKLVDSTAEGIGYAIPISSVLDLINDMMNWETLEKVPEEEASFLGIQNPVSVDSQSAAVYGMPMGVYAYVVKGGPADRAGMRDADIIVGLDRYTIVDAGDLTDALSYFRGGDTVIVTVQRLINGQYEEVELEVTLAYKKDQAN
ncbi:MAG: trypsin-like peptidase domain-containing protein [Lachnospiraceae bacterium]|nr:trypsin-like peptidase domain-containing protein [Lachnospiraceae bacterium]